MTPLSAAELAAAQAKLDRRETALRSRGWQRPTPYTRHDVHTNFKINQWQMRQGIEPEEAS